MIFLECCWHSLAIEDPPPHILRNPLLQLLDISAPAAGSRLVDKPTIWVRLGRSHSLRMAVVAEAR